MTPCYYDKILVDAYADGELSPEEAKKVEEHLTTCEECRQRVGAVKALSHVVGGVLRKTAPGGPIKGLVLSKKEEQVEKPKPVRFWRGTTVEDRWYIGPAVKIAVAACVVVVLGAMWLSSLGSLRSLKVARAPASEETYALKGVQKEMSEQMYDVWGVNEGKKDKSFTAEPKWGPMQPSAAPAEVEGTEQGRAGTRDAVRDTDQVMAKGGRGTRPTTVRRSEVKTKAPQSGRYEESEKSREGDEYNAPMEQGQLSYGGIAPKPEIPAPGPHGIGAPKKAPSRDYKADVGAVTTPTQSVAAHEPVVVGGENARRDRPRGEEQQKKALDWLAKHQQTDETGETSGMAAQAYLGAGVIAKDVAKAQPGTQPQPTTTTGYRGKAGPVAKPAPTTPPQTPESPEVLVHARFLDARQLLEETPVEWSDMPKQTEAEDRTKSARRAIEKAAPVAAPAPPKPKKSPQAEVAGKKDNASRDDQGTEVAQVAEGRTPFVDYARKREKPEERMYDTAMKKLHERLRTPTQEQDEETVSDTPRVKLYKQLANKVAPVDEAEKQKLDEYLTESTIPHSRVLVYPDDWERIVAKAEVADAHDRLIEGKLAQEIRRKLDNRVSFEFVETPVVEAVQYLQSLTKVNMIIDPVALKDIGEWTQVSLKVSGMKSDLALKWVLRLANLDYTVMANSNALFISTPDRIRQGDVLGAAADPNIAASPQMQNTMKLLGLIPEEETGGAVTKQTAKEEAQQFVVLTAEEVAVQEQEAARALEPAQPEQVEPTKEEPAAIETTQGAVFKEVPVNPFVLTENDKFSTFAIDVDTASYALCGRYIKGGYLPPRGAVRMEEFVNAFDYNYPRQPQNVFNVYTEAMPSPFGEGLVLLKVGIMGKVVGREARKPANLVFVIDASGSMDKPDRLPLVQYAVEQLVNVLEPDDRVSLITYGTHANLVLENVPASDRDTILKSVNAIQTSGSTNMLEGIRLGYEIAQRTYRQMTEDASEQGVAMKGVMSRVMLLSDGVANIGTTDAAQILKDVEQYKNFGITFSTAGFGMGSYSDVMLEQLANKGDGSYVFIGSKGEAKRVFGEEMSANLQTIAKDAKIQVEFNPTTVRRYRLVGYENRDIADKDFRNDAIDAGEVGSGQCVTALYELEILEPQVGMRPGDVGTVYVRYRNTDTMQVEEIASRMAGDMVRRYEVNENPRLYLAAAVAEFAELLRESEHAKNGNLAAVENMLRKVAAALTVREQGRLVTDPKVSELIYLVRRARGLPRAQ